MDLLSVVGLVYLLVSSYVHNGGLLYLVGFWFVQSFLRLGWRAMMLEFVVFLYWIIVCRTDVPQPASGTLVIAMAVIQGLLILAAVADRLEEAEERPTPTDSTKTDPSETDDRSEAESNGGSVNNTTQHEWNRVFSNEQLIVWLLTTVKLVELVPILSSPTMVAIDLTLLGSLAWSHWSAKRQVVASSHRPDDCDKITITIESDDWLDDGESEDEPDR